MYAVSHLHLSSWGDFSVSPVTDQQRSDLIFAAVRVNRDGHRQSRPTPR